MFPYASPPDPLSIRDGEGVALRLKGGGEADAYIKISVTEGLALPSPERASPFFTRHNHTFG